MKFESGDTVYIDNFISKDGKVYNGFTKLFVVRKVDDSKFKLFMGDTRPNLLGVRSDHSQFHKIKTILEVRNLKIDKLKKLIADEV